MKQNEHKNIEILVIDDESHNLGVISGYLKDADYRCSVASNGNTALERAVRIKPGVILLDVKMPGMDGFEVCRRLKQNETTQAIPVLRTLEKLSVTKWSECEINRGMKN